MEANKNFIHRFLEDSSKKFIIPVYQRPYSWKKENCDLLFNDLLETYNKKYNSHFFGGIVYVVAESNGINEYSIIDGQQRVTTISILLLSIRNYILNNNIKTKIKTEQIKTAYLIDEYADDDKKTKLKLIQGYDQVYENLILGKETTENNFVSANYSHFYSKLEKLPIEKLEGLYDAIMKLEIVNISLNTSIGDDPQLIFESLNSTSVSLYETDKIRNFILMNMNVNDQEKFYKNYWQNLENKVTRTDMNKFIRYYLADKNFELVNERKLYYEFKDYVSSSDISLVDLLNDMLIYADWYAIIKNSDTNLKGYKSILARLTKLEVNSCIPFIFNVFNAYNQEKINDDKIEKIFFIVENYVVRRFICGLTTNQLNKIFVSLGQEIKKLIKKDNISYYSAFNHSILGKTGKSRFPNNYNFAEKFKVYELYNDRPKMKKYFFERIENYSSKEKIAVEEQIDDGTLTIEHIMPQTLTIEWKESLGDNWEVIHTKYKDTIGNLTLTAYNSDYSNLSFLSKKYMKDKGFNYSKLDLNKFLKDCNEWTEESIIARAETLYKLAEKIWWIPVSKYNIKENTEWFYWDEDIDYRNTEISKIKFMSNEINTTNMTDAYKKIHTNLYKHDSGIYLSKENELWGKNKEDFRSDFEILTGVHIELNYSSTIKMNNIKKLAKLYNLEPNDIQLLVKTKTKKISFDINNEETISWYKEHMQV